MAAAVNPPPLFTTSPLRRPSFTSQFSASPLSTHNSHTATVSPTAGPTAVAREGRPVFSVPEPLASHQSQDLYQDQHQPLTFTKIPIRSTPTWTSIDSKAFSDAPLDSSSTVPSRISRNPSLLTFLFQSNSGSTCSSRVTSSTGSSHASPITPTTGSRSGRGVWGLTPILQRSPASASTSARENHRAGTFPGAASASPPLTKSTRRSPTPPPIPNPNTDPRHQPSLCARRSCTLKFAVVCASTSPEIGASSILSTSRMRISRSPAPVRSWDDLPSSLPVEVIEESDEDEGYVEDEEVS